MADGPSTTRHTFMVRLWEEASADLPNQWRGSVEHVRSGRMVYFVDLADLGAFIQENIGKGAKHEDGHPVG